jgi:RHS repeat-associated protein
MLAFGEATLDEDPDGDGTDLALNTRFPGQYFDAESGLHYNYFRDYDPTTGRYVESDPSGLMDGTNTYAYTKSNPILFTDSSGLLRDSPSGSGPTRCVYVAQENIGKLKSFGAGKWLPRYTVRCIYFCPPGNVCPEDPEDYLVDIIITGWFWPPSCPKTIYLDLDL